MAKSAAAVLSQDSLSQEKETKNDPTKDTHGIDAEETTTELPPLEKQLKKKVKEKRARVRKVRLTREEKKARDKQRLREQVQKQRQKQIERYHQESIQSHNKREAFEWQQNQQEQQELMLVKFELDQVNCRVINPIAAGYEFAINDSSSVIFQRATVQQLNESRNEDQLKHQATFSSEVVHPACAGYEILPTTCTSSEVLSPVFYGTLFQKQIPFFSSEDSSEDEDDDKEDHIRSSWPLNDLDFQDRIDRFRRHRIERPSRECHICVSILAPGCPGCWNIPDHFLPSVYTSGKPTTASDEPRETTAELPSSSSSSLKSPERLLRSAGMMMSSEKLERIVDESSQHDMLGSRFPITEDFHPTSTITNDDDFQDSDDEEEFVTMSKEAHEMFHDEALMTRRMVLKHRAKTKKYIHFIVKSVPAGSAVELTLDSQDTIQYLYDLYRANFDQPNRKIYILLPTSAGFFYFNDTVVPKTDTTLATVKGQFTLEDYNLHPPIDQTIVLVSLATLSKVHTPETLRVYLRNNFLLTKAVNYELREIAAHVPHHICSDEIQSLMTVEVTNMISAHQANQHMSQEYLIQRQKLLIQQLCEQKLQEQLNKKRKKQANNPRTKRERRAWMCFNTAMENNNDDDHDDDSSSLTLSNSTSAPTLAKEQHHAARLTKLWTCFNTFEELKLMKRGKVVEATASDDIRNLLSKHRMATLESFKVCVQSPDHRLSEPLRVLQNKKLVIELGKRMTIKSSRDTMDFGLYLDLNMLESENGHVTIQAFRPIEWKPTDVLESFYSLADLFISPFYRVHWTYMAQAVACVRMHQLPILRQLEDVNTLVSVFHRSTKLKPHELTRWRAKLEVLTDKVGRVGALAQACKRLQSKSGLLSKRGKSKSHSDVASGEGPEDPRLNEKVQAKLQLILSSDPMDRLDLKNRPLIRAEKIKADFIRQREKGLVLKSETKASKLKDKLKTRS